MKVEYGSEFAHWKRWQPDLIHQQLVESRLVYPFVYGVKIQGFNRLQWAVLSIDGLEESITGRKYREADRESPIFLAEGKENADLSVQFVTLQGDRDLEKWFEVIIRSVMKQFKYEERPSGFQPEEIEYVDNYRRDFVIHYLNFNLESIRSLTLKKVLPIQMSQSSLNTTSSEISITTVTFDVMDSKFTI